MANGSGNVSSVYTSGGQGSSSTALGAPVTSSIYAPMGSAIPALISLHSYVAAPVASSVYHLMWKGVLFTIPIGSSFNVLKVVCGTASGTGVYPMGQLVWTTTTFAEASLSSSLTAPSYMFGAVAKPGLKSYTVGVPNALDTSFQIAGVAGGSGTGTILGWENNADIHDKSFDVYGYISTP
jgi:hypothetical protein